MNQSAAFFDLDRTLISGASAFPIGLEAWRQGLASRKEITGWATAALSFLVLGDRGGASDDTRTAFLARIEGTSADAMDTLATSVLPKLVARVRPESKKLLKMHREAHRDTWIVSASPTVIVEPLARALNMEGGLGTSGRVVDGHYTGELDGPFMYGQGKAEAIEKLASERGYDLERCYAYSDSVSDLPMMELVGHPVVVNPDGDLERIAREREWEVRKFVSPISLRDRINDNKVSGAAVAGGVAALVTYWALKGRKTR